MSVSSPDLSALAPGPVPLAVPQSLVELAPETGNNGMEAFARLQRRLLMATVLVSTITVVITALLASPTTTLSLLVGSLAGLVYLWLLGRSVARLGEQSRRLSKIQLLVPVVLVLASSRIPQLSTLPALLGFLLYKPAVIAQAVLDR